MAGCLYGLFLVGDVEDLGAAPSRGDIGVLINHVCLDEAFQLELHDFVQTVATEKVDMHSHPVARPLALINEMIQKTALIPIDSVDVRGTPQPFWCARHVHTHRNDTH